MLIVLCYKARIIAQKLNSTRRRVELSCWAINRALGNDAVVVVVVAAIESVGGYTTDRVCDAWPVWRQT